MAKRGLMWLNRVFKPRLSGFTGLNFWNKPVKPVKYFSGFPDVYSVAPERRPVGVKQRVNNHRHLRL
jgi:hypothetical protein